MRVIDTGALRGYISVNRSWAGHEEEEYIRVSRIAMGMEEGDLRVDLENEHLPDAGRRLVGMTDDNGIQRISRELSDMEKRVKAQLEGKTMEEYEQENTPPMKKGFQVVGANLFSQAFEPVVRISSRSISFNARCIGKLNTMAQGAEGPMCQKHNIPFAVSEKEFGSREDAMLWMLRNQLGRRKGCFYAQFNMDGLMRGDYKSRMEGYAIARQNGWMSANDIRELENMNPIPDEDGGNEYLVNGNMIRIAQAAQNVASNVPAAAQNGGDQNGT